MTGEVALVASTGGHVDEAFEIAGQFADRSRRFWITARTVQTETLLAGEQVEWVSDIRARQAVRAARAFPGAFRLMRRRKPGRIVSTGSALAVPYLLAARMAGVPVTYVESATRLAGPSLTGRIAERIPGAELFCQSEGWDRNRWAYFGSVFDRYIADVVPPRPVRSALLTIGSEQFPFERALVAVRDGLDDGVEVCWQTGNTPAVGLGLGGESRAWWPGDELARKAREVDVVITHAGVGSILMVLRAGSCPVVVPRMHELGEHVDEHQSQLASFLEQRGLAVVARPGDDLGRCVAQAMCRRIVKRDD